MIIEAVLVIVLSFVLVEIIKVLVSNSIRRSYLLAYNYAKDGKIGSCNIIIDNCKGISAEYLLQLQDDLMQSHGYDVVRIMSISKLDWFQSAVSWWYGAFFVHIAYN